MKNIIVKKSKINGNGVFASNPIKNGETIEVCPLILLPRKERKLIEKTSIYDYYFGWGKDKKQPAIALGYGSLYNHSFKPNAVYLKDSKKEIMVFKALTNIKKGEEILVNYNADPLNQTPLWFKAK